jgi:hypothetical protein
MTTLPELQCFNDLLLKKLHRTLKDKEALMKEINAAYSTANQLLSLKETYRSLLNLLDDVGALDDIFQCEFCDKWNHDNNEVLVENSCCDCGYMCKVCDENLNLTFDCSYCDNRFCRQCEEEQEGRINIYKGNEYCSECIDDVCKEDHEELFHEVMEQLKQKKRHREVMEQLVKKRSGRESTMSICELKERGITYPKSHIEYWKNYSGYFRRRRRRPRHNEKWFLKQQKKYEM